MNEVPQITVGLQNLKDKLMETIRTFLLQKEYDTDIEISFNQIHINSKGSVFLVSIRVNDVTNHQRMNVKNDGECVDEQIE